MDLVVNLEAFAAVAEELSFSRAAEELAIAQPLLSRRIKTLEEHLGGALFDRSRRQIDVTEFGAALLPYARDVLRGAERLHAVARSARASAVCALGVPPDCDPPTLARLIRAAAARDLPISVTELPAGPRAAALADGSLTLALIRVPARTGTLDVPLGLASPAPDNATRSGRPVHLESLRPRRGADRATHPALLVTPEDDIPLFTGHLLKAAAGAGLAEAHVRVTSATSTALAEMLAGQGLLLCTEQFARRHQVSWAPLADSLLHRGYELSRAAGQSTPDSWLLPLLGAAVGSAPSTRSDTPGTLADDPDARARLAVHG
jgi:DNA-binding transcriptional LysR family regulator